MYIVGSGWWCSGNDWKIDKDIHVVDDPIQRMPEFHRLWHQTVTRFSKPNHIIIVDSHSPIRPTQFGDEQWLILRENFGFSSDLREDGAVQSLSGADRAILMGAMHAYCNDADFVYIEQDCLIYGDGIIEWCMKNHGDFKLLLGNGERTPQPIQQAFQIWKREWIPELINHFCQHKRYAIEPKCQEKYWWDALGSAITWLKIGYGRQRPIDFNDRYFYAQHWTIEELQNYHSLVRNAGKPDASLPQPPHHSPHAAS